MPPAAEGRWHGASSARARRRGRLASDPSSYAGNVEQLHLQAPVAVEAGAFEAEGGVEQGANLELARKLAVVEEDCFHGHALEGAEAGAPVLPLVSELAALRQAHAFGREGRVLEACPKGARRSIER